MPEENEEQIEEEPEEVKGEGTGNLFGPEAIIMLSLSVLLDSIGVILVCFGLDDFGITDKAGILSISVWMYMRSQTVATPERLKKRVDKGLLRKLFRGGPAKRISVPIIGEIIPYFGAFSCWTLAVYYELTS